MSSNSFICFHVVLKDGLELYIECGRITKERLIRRTIRMRWTFTDLTTESNSLNTKIIINLLTDVNNNKADLS